MAQLRVRIEQSKCIAAGQCVDAAPEVFDQRPEDGIVVLLIEEPDEALAPQVKKAVRLCPAKVIEIEVA